jgi:hypothetical protein
MTQGTRTTTDQDFISLIKQIQRTRDPTALLSDPKSKALAAISRIYFLPNSKETKDESYQSPCERAADAIATFVGDGNSSVKYHVGKNGTTRGQTLIPTRDDLRGQVEIGDWITFERQAGEGEEENTVWGTQYQVENIYHEALELASPGLKHKVTKAHTFIISRYKRAIPSPLLDFAARGKNVAGYMRHQPLDGPMFILTQGNAMSIIPWLFGGTTPEALLQVLKTTERPWTLQLTFQTDTGSPNPQLCKVFSTRGFVTPLRTPSTCEKLRPLLIILLLGVIMTLVTFYMRGVPALR